MKLLFPTFLFSLFFLSANFSFAQQNDSLSVREKTIEVSKLVPENFKPLISTSSVIEDDRIQLETALRNHQIATSALFNSDPVYYKSLPEDQLNELQKLPYSEFMKFSQNLKNHILSNKTLYENKITTSKFANPKNAK